MTLSIECKNFYRSLQILSYLAQIGAEYFILCPGSRSAPLAIAAGVLYKKGLIKLFNSIDERSAGFHALGISEASGKIVVVITTSGTAVANLLPSAVEADKSSNKVIYITADRPLNLKDCGANQTVNQEEFLKSVCNIFLSTHLKGIHISSDLEIDNLLVKILKNNINSSGPVHLNIPFEKPLSISEVNKKKVLKLSEKFLTNKDYPEHGLGRSKKQIKRVNEIITNFNLSASGIIIVGPYRGSSEDLNEFNNALEEIQNLTGWPIFADPISGVRSTIRGLVENWEIIISHRDNKIRCDHLLRLGPMPTSNKLESFLKQFIGKQFLIKENDSRNLDPTKKSIEYDFGIKSFVEYLKNSKPFNKNNSNIEPLTYLANDLIKEGNHIKGILQKSFYCSKKITEISLAHFIPKIWPSAYPIMLSASSPIRDWLTFSGNKTLTRRCFSFRGASGIDGTLSLALGIARINNPLLLVTGDLAFLHDINGFLIENSHDLILTILIIDNQGGNIFNNLYKNDLSREEIRKLFIMPKILNWEKIAEAHQIPYKVVERLNDLKDAFDWSISVNGIAIIKINIDADYDINERNNIIDCINRFKFNPQI